MQKNVNSNHRLVLFSSLIGNLSDATTPSQSEPGSDGNKGVLRIPQSSSIIGTSPSDCMVSYPMGGVLPIYRDAVGIFYSPNRLGKVNNILFFFVSLQMIMTIVYKFSLTVFFNLLYLEFTKLLIEAFD